MRPTKLSNYEDPIGYDTWWLSVVNSLVIWHRKSAQLPLLRSPNPESNTCPPTLVTHSGLRKLWVALYVNELSAARIAHPLTIGGMTASYRWVNQASGSPSVVCSSAAATGHVLSSLFVFLTLNQTVWISGVGPLQAILIHVKLEKQEALERTDLKLFSQHQ